MANDLTLTNTQLSRRDSLVAIVRAGLSDAHLGLQVLKDEKLYRPQTWDAFCLESFGIHKRAANYRIAAEKGKSGQNFAPFASDALVREAMQADEEMQPAVTEAIAADPKPTAAKVKAFVLETKGKSAEEVREAVEEYKRRAMEDVRRERAEKKKKADAEFALAPPSKKLARIIRRWNRIVEDMKAAAQEELQLVYSVRMERTRDGAQRAAAKHLEHLMESAGWAD